MGLVSEVARQVPGVRHIAAGCFLSGVGWFVAFVLAVNFGLLAPVAWPGERARAVRVVLLGAALVIWAVSRRRASRLERGR